MSRARAAIILAAGHGSRMASDIAKPLHPVAGRSMLDWSLALADAIGAERRVVIWGAHGPEVRDAAQAAGAETALQDPPQGTGHAVMQAEADTLRRYGNLSSASVLFVARRHPADPGRHRGGSAG